MGAVRGDRDRRDRPARQHDPAGTQLELLDDLLDGHERAARAPARPPSGRPVIPQSWTLPCRSACWAWMIPTSGRSAGTAESSSPVNGHSIAATRVLRGKVGSAVAPQHGERQVRRARRVGRSHPGVRVLLELERSRPVVLDRVAEAVQRADAGIPAPREDELPGAAGADQLVVDHVGRHPDERQLPPALPHELVPGRVRDQMREPLERDGLPVRDERRDRIGQAQDLCHVRLSLRTGRGGCRSGR